MEYTVLICRLVYLICMKNNSILMQYKTYRFKAHFLLNIVEMQLIDQRTDIVYNITTRSSYDMEQVGRPHEAPVATRNGARGENGGKPQ